MHWLWRLLAKIHERRFPPRASRRSIPLARAFQKAVPGLKLRKPAREIFRIALSFRRRQEPHSLFRAKKMRLFSNPKKFFFKRALRFKKEPLRQVQGWCLRNRFFCVRNKRSGSKSPQVPLRTLRSWDRWDHANGLLYEYKFAK